jgi:hypothetical protein
MFYLLIYFIVFIQLVVNLLKKHESINSSYKGAHSFL